MRPNVFMRQAQEDGRAEIHIFGDLEPWADHSAANVAQRIRDLDAREIAVHIDSCGGAASEGWALYNALREHPARVVTYGDGFVASAALYPFLAGDERVASTLSAYYFHRVLCAAEGYADDLRAAADGAERLTEIGVRAFVERAGMDAELVRRLMRNETWLSPDQALECGLATRVAAPEAPPFSPAQSARRAVMQRVLMPAPPVQADPPPAQLWHTLAGM